MGKDLHYTVVFLPTEIACDLPFGKSKRLRVNAEVNGVSVEGTWMPTRGQWYLMTPKKLMAKLKVDLGDEVTVRFAIADQDAVSVPQALAEALDTHSDLAEVWDSWTPGKRRGWAHRVSSAKTPPTIAKRVDEVLSALADA